MDTPHIASGLMSGNFLSFGDGESKYLKARKAAFQSDSAMVNRQNAILTIGLIEAAYAENYAQQMLAGKRAARRLREEQGTSAAETSQRNLDEIKEHVERKAEEALAPQDAEGRPLSDSINASPAPAAPKAPAAVPAPAPAEIDSTVLAPENGDGGVAAPVSIDMYV